MSDRVKIGHLGNVAEDAMEQLRKLSESDLLALENSLALQRSLVSAIRRERMHSRRINRLNAEAANNLPGADAHTDDMGDYSADGGEDDMGIDGFMGDPVN